METAQVVTAATAKDYREARRLFEQYRAFLGMDLEFQGFRAELDSLAVMYGPPRGSLLLARVADEFVGCAGLRDLGASVAEMKRMYVLPAYQGRGVGKLLTVRLLEIASGLGYEAVRLDTISRLDRAVTLYRKLGFIEIDAYRYNPDPTVIYMEKRLTPVAP